MKKKLACRMKCLNLLATLHACVHAQDTQVKQRLQQFEACKYCSRQHTASIAASLKCIIDWYACVTVQACLVDTATAMPFDTMKHKSLVLL